MKNIKISRITHRGESRIKVVFERDTDLISKIKTIRGRRWSKTKTCWHIPYSVESFEELKAVFGESRLDYDKKDKKTQAVLEKEVYLPKKEVQFFEYRRNEIGGRKVVGEYLIIKKRTDVLLEAYVPYEKKGWTEVVRNIIGRRWDVDETCWALPNVKTTYRQLYKNIPKDKLVFNFEIKSDIPEVFELEELPQNLKKRGFELLTATQQKAVNATVDKIILKQYSPKTLKSYRNHLVALFIFFEKTEPDLIKSEDVEKYLLHLIKFKKISESTQNQIISAYKLYAELVLRRDKQFVNIQRPKKPKKLPGVLSGDEVIRLINSPKNLKHKLILLLIYSAGLRLNEVTKIRVRDINLDRRTIFIKAGKGKKDRYVTLAEEVIPYLKSYKSEYKPVYWLLEGNTGGQYSSRSVQSIFRAAVEKSKISAFATVHTLRHSYATHCIENGFSTALVQQALGHQSIKTTERYLHVSSAALKKMRSPLDIISNKKV